MEDWPVLIAILIIHALMFVATAFSIYDCPFRSFFEKLLFLLAALFLPVVGPLYVNYKLGMPPRKGGRLFDSDMDFDSFSSTGSDSGGSSDSGGGGSD